ncbi:hypothetical protein GIB67_027176 [Kingdonia uniflora]|uniref:Carbohydrate kinase PfkB domain-containing protein n=1 Tax=Kingdonia uniflora TaxID=39325 RepID=A0A7J7P223_9MAGN|nr:hypothetical protein GIB67_027176 [Kingdonia uniflora]
MHLQTLKIPICCNIQSPKLQNPRLINGFSQPLPIYNCKGNEVSNSNNNRFNNSLSFSSNNNGGIVKSRKGLVGVKDVDVVTLGNLCVDVVLSVPSLPPVALEERKAYMEKLSSSRPDKKYWEAGGNCNMTIAAARLGLRCLTLGHVGNEIYGHFLLDVLLDEGIGMVEMSDDTKAFDGNSPYETLLCWVLVDPSQKHGFCSRADFSKDPAFSWMSKLSGEVKKAIRQSKILFCNGYAFDELSPSVIISALEYAMEVGTSIFFDPGPRGRTLSIGTPEQQRALSLYLSMSDVLLLTSDEAESLTGIKNPILAGQQLLNKGVRTKWVIIKMGSKGSILITRSSISCAPAFKVNVMDTVGCGDSFVAAIAFGYLHDMPTVNTITLANAVGAATAMGCGAGRNVATLEKVMELIVQKDSKLAEDDDFSNLFLDENSSDTNEVMLVSKSTNGISSCLNHVSLQKVLSELLPKLEIVNDEKRMVPS